MKNWGKTNRSFLVFVAVLAAFTIASCGPTSNTGDTSYEQVDVAVKGLSVLVDNVIEVSLPAEIGGTMYLFEVIGTAGVSEADFTLNIYYGSSNTDPLEYSVDFSLPIAEVDGIPGESGYGETITTIMPGSGYTSVGIIFEWGAVPPLEGDAIVDITFQHAPRIISWSMTPAPIVEAGTNISIQADIDFYGTTPAVEAQYWDNDGAGYLDSPISLVDMGGGIWTGTIAAASGAEELHLTATDSDGSMTSSAFFEVP